MKLDRTYFKMGSHQESGDNRKFWASQTMEARLKAAFYLNSVTYNFDINFPPKMDKTIFKARKNV